MLKHDNERDASSKERCTRWEVLAPLLEMAAAGCFLRWQWKGLQKPQQKTTMGLVAFAPIGVSHLAAPQLGIVFALLAARRIARYLGSGKNKLLSLLSASLSTAMLASCLEVLRRSLWGRAMFAIARAPEAASADIALQSTKGSVKPVGTLSLSRCIGTSLGLPLQEWSQLKITRGIQYALADGHSLCLDAIRRRALPTGAPMLLYFHGGGWTAGDKAMHSLPLLYGVALKMGWLVLTANYRLSSMDLARTHGGTTFPDHLHDCLRAVAWARGPKALDYGGGGSTLVVAGESAGGHLACLVGLAHKIPRMRPPDLQGNLQVDAVIDLYGLHDPRLEPKDLSRFFRYVVLKCSRKDPQHEQTWNDASPVWWVQQAGAEDIPAPPPFFIVHGTHDSLIPVEDARRFHDDLCRMRQRIGSSERRVRDVYIEVPAAIHGFNMAHSPLTYALLDRAVHFMDAVASAQPRTHAAL